MCVWMCGAGFVEWVRGYRVYGGVGPIVRCGRGLWSKESTV
jgi:hypothetical protein